MNRHDEIEWIMRMISDLADDTLLRECIGAALDRAYQEGNRQREEDRAEAAIIRGEQ